MTGRRYDVSEYYVYEIAKKGVTPAETSVNALLAQLAKMAAGLRIAAVWSMGASIIASASSQAQYRGQT